MYFSEFPDTLYLVTPPGLQTPAEYVLLKDITKNVRFKREILNSVVLYDWYVIKENETPEIIAENLYGSPYYHWVIMLLNDMYDWRKDFPKNGASFDAYIVKVYGSLETAKSTVAYYVNQNGLVVDADYLDYEGNNSVTAVSVYDSELAANDAKRRIKIISPQLLTTVLNNFRELMK